MTRTGSHLPKALGLVRSAERELADALALVADRHSNEAEIRDLAPVLAGWSRAHVEGLAPFVARYGAQANDRPARLRAGLFHGTRVGALGLLEDLEDLSQLVNQARMGWLAVYQAARALRDAELEDRAVSYLDQVDRQRKWILTQAKQLAPQALLVPPSPGSAAWAALPKRPSAPALPDPVWAPVGAALLVAVVGLASLAAGRPWLLPSLGPTAYLVAEHPAHPSSRFYNVVVGHLLGLLAGFFAVWALGAWAAPSPLRDGTMAGTRVAAAVVAVGLALLLAHLLRASHPPAGATALLVALGALQAPGTGIEVAVGAVLIGVAGELVRRVRLRGSISRPVVAPETEVAAPPADEIRPERRRAA